MFLKKATNKISTWLVWSPLMYVIAFIPTMFVCVYVAYLFSEYFGPLRITFALAKLIAFIVPTILYIRHLPSDDLNRREFVALNTAQMLIVNFAIMIMVIALIVALYKLDTLTVYQATSFILDAEYIIVPVCLYILGVFVGNIYAKYRRARAIGIAPWKIICTIPFGFPMLWIAGYMLPDAKTQKTKSAGRYARLVDTICKNNAVAYATLILLIMSGLSIGLRIIPTVVALISVIIFAIWRHKQNSLKHYSSIAIVINMLTIATWIFLII